MIRNIQLRAPHSLLNLHIRIAIEVNLSNNHLMMEKNLVFYQDLFWTLTKRNRNILGDKDVPPITCSFEDDFPTQEEEESFNEEEDYFEKEIFKEEILNEDRFETDDYFPDELYYK